MANPFQAQYAPTDLQAGTTPTGTEVAHWVQGGSSVQLSVAQIIAAAASLNFIWTPWVPVLTSVGGAITAYAVNNARFLTFGKLTNIELDVSITTVGTASGDLLVTLPNTPARNFVVVGRDITVSGKMLQGSSVSSPMHVCYFDSTSVFPSGNGVRLVLNGSYENQ